jgi:hypothetical protein
MFSAAAVLANIEAQLPDALKYSVRFAKPVVLPARIGLYVDGIADGCELTLRHLTKGDPHFGYHRSLDQPLTGRLIDCMQLNGLRRYSVATVSLARSKLGLAAVEFGDEPLADGVLVCDTRRADDSARAVSRPLRSTESDGPDRGRRSVPRTAVCIGRLRPSARGGHPPVQCVRARGPVFDPQPRQ